MKTFIILFFILSSSFGYSSSYDEECQILDHSISPPDYAETEEERITRLETELFLALEHYDSCLEAAELNTSPSSSASSSASGEQTQVSNSSSGESAESVLDNNPRSQEELDQYIQGVNGDTPEDIPADSTDDVTAAQMKATAKAEKDPDKREKYWNLYREYKGIKKE